MWAHPQVQASRDGDAMVLAVLATLSAIAQARVLSYVHEMMISAKDSRPVVTPVQDGTLGASVLSRSSAKYTPQEAQAILAGARLHGEAVAAVFRDARAGGGRFEGTDVPMVSGRALWSAVLKQTPLNYRRGTSVKGKALSNWIPCRPDEIDVKIVRGELLSGVIDKKAIGPSSGGLPALAVQAYGASTALAFVDQAQRLAIAALDRSGLSIGLGDLLVTAPRRRAIREAVGRVIAESRAIAAELTAGAIVPPIGTTVVDHYEALQAAVLQLPDEAVGLVVTGMAPDSNALLGMVAAASKGKIGNIRDILGAVGQTTVNGKRARESLGGRTFPYSPKHSLDPEDHGWISECYTDGTPPMQTHFNAMSGRFDLTTKALTTAETGHLMRKSVMSLQGNVAGASFSSGQLGGAIHAPLYGGDGFETRWLESVRFRTSMSSDAELAKFLYGAVPASFRKAAEAADPETSAVAAAHDGELRRLRAQYRESFGRAAAGRTQTFSDEKMVPVAVGEILYDVLVRESAPDLGAKGGSLAPLSTAGASELAVRGEGDVPLVDPEGFAERLRVVDRYAKELPYLYQNEGRRRAGARVPPHLVAGTFLVQYLVREVLSPPALARLSAGGLAYVLAETSRRFRRAFVAPGSALGILAAQATGEPLTQYMLDSHHRSVEGGTSSSGLDRTKEIFNAVPPEREAAPSMTVVPKLKEGQDPTAAAELLAARLQELTIRGLLVRYDLLYDPYGTPEYPPFAGDRDWVDEHRRLAPGGEPPGDLTRFCGRVVLEPSALVLKGVTLEEIVLACTARAGASAVFIHSAGNGPADEPFVLRVWWRAGAFAAANRRAKKTPLHKVAMEIFEELLDLPIRGVSRIENTAVETYYPRWEEKADGSFDAVENGAPVVTTSGSNLLETAGVPGIDLRFLETTSIGETLQAYGVEAARARIVQQFLDFLGESAPDLRHIEQFADLMTQTGRITAINKSGLVAREPQNVLGQMAMGVPADSLMKAARKGATVDVLTPAAALMTGQLPRLGTNFFDVGIDPDLARQMKVSTQSALDDFDEL